MVFSLVVSLVDLLNIVIIL